MLVAMGLGGTQTNKQRIASMFEKMGGEVWDDFWDTVGDVFCFEQILAKCRSPRDLHDPGSYFLKIGRPGSNKSINYPKPIFSRFTNKKPACDKPLHEYIKIVKALKSRLYFLRSEKFLLRHHDMCNGSIVTPAPQ